MTRSLTGSYPDTRREHHPAAPRVCELPPRQRPLRLPRPSPPRPRTRCRTAALGGHVDECTRCGHRAISYNSCRNRHGPKCQAGARERWLEKRRRELLPTPYVHVVFTLPRDPRHLGAEIGFFSVLHTWNQKVRLRPHEEE
jgi:hypothetical protein